MYLYLYEFLISPCVLHVQIIAPFLMYNSNITRRAAMYFYPEVYYPSGEGLGWHVQTPFTDVLYAGSSMETYPLVIQKNRIQS